MLKLVDTHCHLSSPELAPQVPELLVRAASSGVEKLLNIGYDLPSSQKAVEQLSLSESLYALVGIQPHDAPSFSQEIGLQIKTLARSHNRVVGIGEIGLDGHHHESSMTAQIGCFEYFLNLACELQLPVAIHVRETHQLVLERLKIFSAKGLRGVIHCFTGSAQEACDFLDCGFYLSFSGIVTFKNAATLQNVAKIIPLEKLVIETDSPYLSPVPFRGKVNEPSRLIHVCEFLAQLHSISAEEFANITYLNSHHLFNLPLPTLEII